MSTIERTPVRHVSDFLGSIQIFSTAVNDLLEERLRNVSGTGITFSQIKLLKLVAMTEGHSISDVAAYLGVSNAAASKAVDRMVRRGMLRRTEAESDRRAVELSLTAEGRAVVEAYDLATQEALTELFGSLTPETLKEITKTLDQLSVAIFNRDSRGSDEVCFRCGIHFRERCLLRQTRSRDCFFHQHKKKPAGSGSAG